MIGAEHFPGRFRLATPGGRAIEVAAGDLDALRHHVETALQRDPSVVCPGWPATGLVVDRGRRLLEVTWVRRLPPRGGSA